MPKYGVIHISVGGELFTPLVASQLYDQDEVLSSHESVAKPIKVAAWAFRAHTDSFK